MHNMRGKVEKRAEEKVLQFKYVKQLFFWKDT